MESRVPVLGFTVTVLLQDFMGFLRRFEGFIDFLGLGGS